jgi:hypothetical protein
MLIVTCAFWYKLDESQKWASIYYQHMMQAEHELDQVRTIDFSDQKNGAEYTIRIARDSVKIEPVVKSHPTTIINPLYVAPNSQAE